MFENSSLRCTEFQSIIQQFSFTINNLKRFARFGTIRTIQKGVQNTHSGVLFLELQAIA